MITVENVPQVRTFFIVIFRMSFPLASLLSQIGWLVSILFRDGFQPIIKREDFFLQVVAPQSA